MAYSKLIILSLVFGLAIAQHPPLDDLLKPPNLDDIYDKYNGLKTSPDSISLVKGETQEVIFTFSGNLTSNWTVSFAGTDKGFLTLSPDYITIAPQKFSGIMNITGHEVISKTFVEVSSCDREGDNETVFNATCPFNKTASFLRVQVIHSRALDILVTVTGWTYFVAWSVSFYPQIWLNFKRSSVEGLNFDFLVLNIIGFACYTVYNWLMYFDHEIQDTYLTQHQRAPIPVLTNDVVFATHALIACIITGVQCFFYERGQQRVSYVCMGWGSVLLAFAGVSFAITLFKVIDWLQFINNLSYVKMAVTLSKYFPQVLLNIRRKSTVGWSIGNVLLDFTGGSMDICQMILQAINVDNWSAFYGNPVKFGLGLVSMVFDVVFFIQHYVLYRHTEVVSYDVVETTDNSSTRNLTSPETSTSEAPSHY